MPVRSKSSKRREPGGRSRRGMRSSTRPPSRARERPGRGTRPGSRTARPDGSPHRAGDPGRRSRHLRGDSLTWGAEGWRRSPAPSPPRPARRLPPTRPDHGGGRQARRRRGRGASPRSAPWLGASQRAPQHGPYRPPQLARPAPLLVGAGARSRLPQQGLVREPALQVALPFQRQLAEDLRGQRVAHRRSAAVAGRVACGSPRPSSCPRSCRSGRWAGPRGRGNGSDP